MTSFVQPCDGGIIRCLKAHYRCEFCLRALEKEEAGERDIYMINLLEAMLMAKEAWTEVTTDTIAHCWRHTKILPSSAGAIRLVTTPQAPAAKSTTGNPQHDLKAWEIILEFATSDMGLPQAEAKLQAHLGTRFKDGDWRAALKAVMDAENDHLEGVKSLDKLTMEILWRPISQLHDSAIPPQASNHAVPSAANTPQQLTELEN